ncbi:MAG TPA: ThiF family adenylyltransferase [Bacteroidia bacterium]|nr:ThiF family adenylyltransferase [Bacteroidia bacterium]HNU33562.1 ThiF family adenylyltransferase [Bacteroidia bacterium]
MKNKIRIKQYLHILEKNGIADFIKTLDEGVKLPSGDIVNTVVACLQNEPLAEEFITEVGKKLQLNSDAPQQLLDKLFELKVVELFDDSESKWNRYSRQLLLFDSINPQQEFENNYLAQEKLSNVHIVILGIGGIGNFIATALCVAGAGKITLVDFDLVEETNLNRQILFSETDIGKHKTEAAAQRLKDLNSNCNIRTVNKEINSQSELEKLIREYSPDYIVLSADKPVDIVLWASALCKKYRFKYLKCGYMAYHGLIGPLLGHNTKAYEEIFTSWSNDIALQNNLISKQNEMYIAPSMAATNAILANMAAWELIKDITEISPSVLTERRILFDLKTMNMVFG